MDKSPGQEFHSNHTFVHAPKESMRCSKGSESVYLGSSMTCPPPISFHPMAQHESQGKVFPKHVVNVPISMLLLLGLERPLLAHLRPRKCRTGPLWRCRATYQRAILDCPDPAVLCAPGECPALLLSSLSEEGGGPIQETLF